MYQPDQQLLPAQRRRLEAFAIEDSVDVHCHCLPGLDDGPSNLLDAIALCKALTQDGITAVVATPHQLGRYDGENALADIQHAYAKLDNALKEASIPLKVTLGADVRVDERIPAKIVTRDVLTISDGQQAILLELPHEIYVDPTPLIECLRGQGVQAVMTHPERHPALQRRPSLVRSWIDRGAVLQVTSGSLIGDFGPSAQSTAWRLVQEGFVAIVASDAHDAVRRPPRMTAAISQIARRFGAAAARKICLENPLTLFKGEQIQLGTGKERGLVWAS